MIRIISQHLIIVIQAACCCALAFASQEETKTESNSLVVTSPQSDQPKAVFKHGWQSGNQSYELSDEIVTRGLLTKEDLRAISGSYQLPAAGFDTELVQLASYQEPVTGPIVSDKTSDTDGDLVPDSETAEPRIYESMGPKEIRLEIKKHKDAIASDANIGDAVKASRLQILSSIGESLSKLEDHVRKDRQYTTENQTLKDQLADPASSERSSLEEPVEAESPVIDESTTSDELIQQLNAKRASLEKQKNQLDELEHQIKIRSVRIPEIPADRARASETLGKIREQLSKQISESDDQDKQLARLLQETKKQAAEAELRKLDSEVERQELGAKHDPIERDSASRSVKRLETEVQSFEREIKKLREREVREEQRLASQEAQTAAPILKPLAAENESLVSDRKIVVENLQTLRAELTRISGQTETIVERRIEIENKITAAGLTGTNGMLLVDLRRNLNTTGESHIRIRQLQTELRFANLRKVSLNQERDELANPIEAAKKLVGSEDSDDPLVQKALKFVETKRKYLDQLIDDYQSYGRQVSEVSQARKKLIDEINQTMAYIDENALWIRSSEPVDLSVFVSAKQGMNEFFDGEQWLDVAHNTQQRAGQRPYELSMATVVLLVLMGVNRRVKKKLNPAPEINELST